MIEVDIKINGEPIGHIEIINYLKSDGPRADYHAKFLVERGRSVGLYSRNVHNFPRKNFNVLALLQQVMLTLDERELGLDRDYNIDEAPVSADVARRLGGTLREIQAGVSRPDHY